MAKTVMIVDDAASVRQVVSITLRGAGYDVIEGKDGSDALARLSGKRVQLVISDLNMPNMDGLELLRRLKASAEHKFTPVLMLTTESQDAKKREGQLAGAKAWMVKPFQPAALLAAVEKLVA